MEGDKQKRQFIKETVIPRKKVKRVIAVIFAIIGGGLLFGLVAGVTFTISQNILDEEEEPGQTPAPIIIARDDWPDETEFIDPLEEQTGNESEPAESGETKDPSESENPDETDTPGESGNETGAPDESESESETEPPKMDAKALYESLRNSFTRLTVIRSGEEGSVDPKRISKNESIGIFVAETDWNVMILTDSGILSEDGRIYAEFGGKALPAEVVRADRRTGLAILQIEKTDLRKEVPVVALGNSFEVTPGERVFMIGAPDFRALSIDEGLITDIVQEESVVDGFIQHLYTDMTRSAHGIAALANEAGEIIGWVSDYACGNETEVSAAGISPLKYLIEDLCTDAEIAYLGIRCVAVGEAEAESDGIPSGYYVIEVEENSPAYVSGIQVGDRLITINNLSAGGGRFLAKRMDALVVGEEAKVIIIRQTGNGLESMSFIVTVGARD